MKNNFTQAFLFEHLPIRGVYVELTDVWQQISAQREYAPGIKRLLGELLVSNIALMSGLKLKGKIIIEVHNSPHLDLLVSECTHDFLVRGTAKYNTSKAVAYEEYITSGRLVLNMDSEADGRIYQSVVALSGVSLDKIIEGYMLDSEQLHTLLIIAYSNDKLVAFMLQKLPDCSRDHEHDVKSVFQHVHKTCTKAQLLADPLIANLQYLFSEHDIVLFDPQNVTRSCTCSRERVSNMLRALGQDEALETVISEGTISITCDFCNTLYVFNIEDVRDLFNTLRIDIECISDAMH